jgi:hypothetical protein
MHCPSSHCVPEASAASLAQIKGATVMMAHHVWSHQPSHAATQVWSQEWPAACIMVSWPLRQRQCQLQLAADMLTFGKGQSVVGAVPSSAAAATIGAFTAASGATRSGASLKAGPTPCTACVSFGGSIGCRRPTSWSRGGSAAALAPAHTRCIALLGIASWRFVSSWMSDIHFRKVYC